MWLFQSPIWISNAGHGSNHLQFCRIPIPHRGTRKPFVPAHRLFSQYGFPCRFSDPLRLATGQPRFKSIESECRRFPISLVVFPDPFLVSGGLRLSKHHFLVKVLSIHDMKYSFCQFAGQCLLRFGHSAFPFLLFIPAMNARVKSSGESRRFNKRPCQIFIPVLRVVAALLLIVRGAFASHGATVRGIVSSRRKTGEVSTFQDDEHAKSHSDPRHRCDSEVLLSWLNE